MPVELHYRVAVLVVEALSQWVSVADGKTVMAVSRLQSALIFFLGVGACFGDQSR